MRWVELNWFEDAELLGRIGRNPLAAVFDLLALVLAKQNTPLLREAFGVRGACSRFRTAPRLTTAPASWTHSRRFAWQSIQKYRRSLRAISTIAIQSAGGLPPLPFPHSFVLGRGNSLAMVAPASCAPFPRMTLEPSRQRG